MNIESCPANKRRRRAMLIFNPIAGAADQSPVQLLDIINAMQAWRLVPETYLVEPECDLSTVIQGALQRGIRLFVVCGGDGTIESVAGALIGTHATLGIIPTGTQNNVALSLGIPRSIPAAVALLRAGRRIKIDVGVACCQCASGREITRRFLETCSVGLISALYPVVDDIQHGNLARIGDLLATLITYPSADIHLEMDGPGGRELHTKAHVVFIANLPYVGPHYPIAVKSSYTDGLLDVLVFADFTKLDLLSHAVRVAGGSRDDPRISRYRVRRIKIHTDPPMPVIADGFPLGEGPLTIRIERRALGVMVGGKAKTPVTAEKKKVEMATDE